MLEDLCIIKGKRKGWLLFRSSPIYFSLIHFETLRKSRAEIDAAYLFFEIYAEWLFPMNGALVFDFLCFCDTLCLRAWTGANVTYETVRWWQVKTKPHRHTSKHYYPVWQEVRCVCPFLLSLVKSICAFNGESLNQFQFSSTCVHTVNCARTPVQCKIKSCVCVCVRTFLQFIEWDQWQ